MSRSVLPPIVGDPCASPLDGAQHIGDFAWYDGPLSSLFRDASGLLYVHWFDNDERVNRWGVVRISREHLDALGAGTITLRDVLTQPDAEAWVLDLGTADGRVAPIACARTATLPVDYLPDADSHLPRDDWFHLEALEAA